MTIDNFGIFEQRLEFKEPTDRYIVHVLRRPKDVPAIKNALGSNETQRLIRTYYIDNIEYFKRKKAAIIELCRSNNARAYILPQVRNNYECLLNLGQKVLETIRMRNMSVKPEHLLRSAYCEYHRSRDKKWILDLDNDCMTEYKLERHFPRTVVVHAKTWTQNEVLELVKDLLSKSARNPDDAYLVNTRSGCHIVTPPFDLAKAGEQCSMFFEGEKKFFVGHKDVGPGETEPIYKNIVGWLHKDGMSLLYYSND